MRFFTHALLAASLLLATVPTAHASSESVLLGLTENNTLVAFRSRDLTKTKKVMITGVTGTLVGIDYRPANGALYGLSTNNQVYTIEPTTGVATLVATLSVSFGSGKFSGVDFNPVADRLRVVGDNDENLRIDVTTGTTTVDLPLAYSLTDTNVGKNPSIIGAGYTDTRVGATTTKLFNIDATQDVLVVQNPPNNGTLSTVGPLGVDFGATGGFDIFVDDNGINAAFAVSGATLYRIDLATGKANEVGPIGDGLTTFIGLTGARNF